MKTARKASSRRNPCWRKRALMPGYARRLARAHSQWTGGAAPEEPAQSIPAIRTERPPILASGTDRPGYSAGSRRRAAAAPRKRQRPSVGAISAGDRGFEQKRGQKSRGPVLSLDSPRRRMREEGAEAVRKKGAVTASRPSLERPAHSLGQGRRRPPSSSTPYNYQLPARSFLLRSPKRSAGAGADRQGEEEALEAEPLAPPKGAVGSGF